LEPLARRIAAAGIRVERAAGAGRLVVDDLTLRLCDGHSATARGARLAEPLVHLDLALDFASCRRVAIAPGLALAQADAVVGLLQAAGYAVSRIRDTAGMIVMRTMAMLANEAIEAANQGIAATAAIDLAMLKGVNYPRGPLSWASVLGLGQLLAVLDGLSATYGEDRYRASPLLRDLVLAGRTRVDIT
jgi:3-hydroxybutyryl-CoA dehydrogenase